MRRPRLKAPSSMQKAYYHCVSRVVNRDFVLQVEEKEQFVKYMRAYEALYGLRVISYCVMSNHFHILVEVPKRPDFSDLPDDIELVAHVRKCLGEEKGDVLEAELRGLRDDGSEASVKKAEAVREKWFGRMWDVSSFMKVLKQRFTQWFNGKHSRRGTLWEERFRSVLVQGESHALRAMAAYIDLNPVRAGICDDPKEYRWCGYGEAIGGVGETAKMAREAVRYLASFDLIEVAMHQKCKSEVPSPRKEAAKELELRPFKSAQERWRRFIIGLPEDEGTARKVLEEVSAREETPHEVTGRDKVSREKALEVLKQGGKLSLASYARCKIRYFSDGAALGARGFIEEIFTENRKYFSETRKDGAKPLRGLRSGDNKKYRLYNLRALQKDVWS